MKNLCTIICFLILGYPSPLYAQQNGKPVFKVVPLGVKGGIDESNLSSYMLAVEGTNDYICLDAGTLHYGIQKAIDSGIFTVSASHVLRNYIKAYFISHAHLDHVAGLILNSPEDSSKNIYGTSFCLDILKDKYFTWKNWANFANEGDKPALGKYHYSVLVPQTETAIDNTRMYVTAFTLSHSNPYQSTAFLIRNNESYFLYLGDTGSDEIENANDLHTLWQFITPLIKQKKLRAIFIEVSFPNEQPDKQLFGHLTPKLLMQEMQSLSGFAGKDAMKNLQVAITHIKPNGNNEEKIKKQLAEVNTLQLHLIFPQQGKVLQF
jgi:cAMP phosphodiesterase